MKKWYSLIPDGSMDYAIRNNQTGEIEALIMKNCGHRGWLRYMKDCSGNWKPTFYRSYFSSLKEVRQYYDQIT